MTYMSNKITGSHIYWKATTRTYQHIGVPSILAYMSRCPHILSRSHISIHQHTCPTKAPTCTAKHQQNNGHQIQASMPSSAAKLLELPVPLAPPLPPSSSPPCSICPSSSPAMFYPATISLAPPSGKLKKDFTLTISCNSLWFDLQITVSQNIKLAKSP